MKKKWIVGVVIMTIVCAAAVIFALTRSKPPTPKAEAPSPFVLRNGVMWGMSPDDVAARESSQPYPRVWDEARSVTGCHYAGQKLSRYDNASVDYIFCEGKLCMAFYQLNTPDAAEYTYLNNVLCSTYGAGAPVTA